MPTYIPPHLQDKEKKIMASVPSQGWEPAIEDGPEIDGDLLMALLDESQVQEAEDERLGCVIQSLEAEIDHNSVRGSGGLAEPEYHEDQEHWMDHVLGTIGLDDGQINDPFDWVDMDMVTNSHCVDMGNWYVETCGDDVEMGEFVYGGDYSTFCSGDYSSIEHGYSYSPLWQETFDSRMM
ncbi:hypothetical protein MRB53_020117 [Persea americana]|uniref:Uncharacterized protein n=1 Tax=Persea americana TaxID=3435 RepID=A0ACC2L0K2_PERAE|nr:hypothetical protein MRB53_020117 [Persea americana]